MSLINSLVYWSNIILYISVGILVLIGVMIFYMKKIKKPKKATENDRKYANYKREDSATYVPIDDIKDNMIITDNGTRFIGGVICRGFDLFNSHISEQVGTMKGYLGFINIIDQPIQKRIYCKNVDLEKNIKAHKEVLNEHEKQLLNLYKDSISIQKNLQVLNEKDIDIKFLYEDELLKTAKDIKNAKWQIDHIRHVLSYLVELSETPMNPVRESCYLFDWIFNDKNFPQDISDEEIHERAKQELDSKAGQYAHALSGSRVKVKRANEIELREALRKHYQPYSTGIFKEVDIRNSNVDEPIVTSKSLEEMEKKYNQTINDELLESLYQVRMDKRGA